MIVCITYLIKLVASYTNRGIKLDFPFINICKVRREVLKTEGKARGLQPYLGTLRMLMNDKITVFFFHLFGNSTHTGSIGKNCIVFPPIGKNSAFKLK